MARRRAARRRSTKRRTTGSLGSIPRGKCKKTRNGAFLCHLNDNSYRFKSRAQAARIMGR